MDVRQLYTNKPNSKITSVVQGDFDNLNKKIFTTKSFITFLALLINTINKCT